MKKGIIFLMSEFLSHKEIVQSWGIQDLVWITNEVSFHVDGLKYRGDVKVELLENNEYKITVGTLVSICRLSEVIGYIDKTVEKTSNYMKDLDRWIKDRSPQ